MPPGRKASGKTRGGEGKPRARNRKETSLSQKRAGQQRVLVPAVKLAQWIPISQHAHTYITGCLDQTLISSLPPNSSNEEYSQHLRRLRKRLAERCSSILTPPRNRRSFKNSSKLLSLESRHLEEGARSLQTLQEELDLTLDNLEQNREKLELLQEEIRKIRESMEEEDLQVPPATNLDIPTLPPASFEQQTLQDQLTSQEDLLSISSDVQSLVRSEELRDLLAFLERCHSAVDPSR